ncbi:hypothetical protein C8R44DRAFT_747235 [Mycena epipterygia]|nr:hypothetical protein C8R44DRAFT_747235 [Mycena epipterygia]
MSEFLPHSSFPTLNWRHFKLHQLCKNNKPEFLNGLKSNNLVQASEVVELLEAEEGHDEHIRSRKQKSWARSGLKNVKVGLSQELKVRLDQVSKGGLGSVCSGVGLSQQLWRGLFDSQKSGSVRTFCGRLDQDLKSGLDQHLIWGEIIFWMTTSPTPLHSPRTANALRPGLRVYVSRAAGPLPSPAPALVSCPRTCASRMSPKRRARSALCASPSPRIAYLHVWSIQLLVACPSSLTTSALRSHCATGSTRADYGSTRPGAARVRRLPVLQPTVAFVVSPKPAALYGGFPPSVTGCPLNLSSYAAATYHLPFDTLLLSLHNSPHTQAHPVPILCTRSLISRSTHPRTSVGFLPAPPNTNQRERNSAAENFPASRGLRFTHTALGIRGAISFSSRQAKDSQARPSPGTDLKEVDNKAVHPRRPTEIHLFFVSPSNALSEYI